MAERYAYLYRVHPAVGVARMGSSPTTYFLAAEQPGQPFNPEQRVIPGMADDRVPGHKGIRDKHADKRLCKQAARFRVFCYKCNARTRKIEEVWECTPADYEIMYSVTVANLKSSLGTSKSQVVTVHESTGPGLPVRLHNKPDRLNFSSADTPNVVKIFTGKPAGRLDLGSAFMDIDGRLIVIGSSGRAQRIKDTAISADPAHRTALANAKNHEPWNLYWAGFEDDAADGPVEATIKPKSTSSKPDKGVGQRAAVEAWVVIAVPDYAPDVRAATTLYDIALNHAYDMAKNKKTGWAPPNLDAFTTYHACIYPIMKAQYAVPYVIGPAKTADEGVPHHVSRRLTKPTSFNNAKNTDLKYWLRKAPATSAIKPESIWQAYAVNGNAFLPAGDPQPGPVFKPKSVADVLSNTKETMPNLWYTTPTELQFRAIDAWSDGLQAAGDSTAFTRTDPAYIPYQLDRVHLESMSGGSFYPGIEVGRQAHWPKTWEGREGSVAEHYDVRVARRVKDDGKSSGVATPGYLTEFLACPWQADFIACDHTFWPHSRPITVQKGASTGSALPDLFVWMSDGTAATTGDVDDAFATSASASAAGVITGGLFDTWWKLGFVSYDNPGVSTQIIEKQRHPTIRISKAPTTP